jgi:hypothetical protein
MRLIPKGRSTRFEITCKLKFMLSELKPNQTEIYDRIKFEQAIDSHQGISGFYNILQQGRTVTYY